MLYEKIPYVFENDFSIDSEPVTKISDCLSAMTEDQLEFLAENYGVEPFSTKKEAVEYFSKAIPDITQVYFEYVSIIEHQMMCAILNNVERYGFENLSDDDQLKAYFDMKVIQNLIDKGLVFHFISDDEKSDNLIISDEVKAVLKQNIVDGFSANYGKFENVIDIEKILTSLYGLVDDKLFLRYWNNQFPENTIAPEDAFLVMKYAAYVNAGAVNYNDKYIFHIGFYEEEVENILESRKNKPEFFMPKSKFAKVWKDYEDVVTEDMFNENGDYEIEYLNPAYIDMKKYLQKMRPEDGDIILLCILNYMKKGCPVNECIKLVNNEFALTDKFTQKDFEKFMTLYSALHNSTHLWVNFGWAPSELRESSNISIPENLLGQNGMFIPPELKVIPKVGRNEPCPCGSGKKYKQCHGR